MMPSPNEKNPSQLAMESGTSSLTPKHVPSGTNTPERPPSMGSPGSPVSDDTCPICLGHITDKCVADSCLHSFCLVCLKEWAKQKAVCPLCKLTFTKIMHDIKSETEYKEWKVPRPDPVAERSAGIPNIQEYLDAERRRFFGYRTTNFPGAATIRRFHPGRIVIPDALPSGPRERRPTRYNLRGSSMFRLSVYLNNVWVQPIADITGRYRQTSPELYREQPALTHRLVPWINRELAALLPSSRIGAVLAEVMELIERHAINSREFKRALQVHLGRRTNHFIHEFYHFARSPYDMVGHDNASHYLPRYGFNDDESSSSNSSSDDSDAVVEVDSTGNPINAGSSSNQGPSASGNVIREETLTQEGSVVISSEDSTSSDSEDDTRLAPSILSTSTHNPEPPGSKVNDVSRLLGRAREFLSTINEGASTSRSEGPTNNSAQSVSNNLKKEAYDSDDSDACIILDEIPPKKDRTPEVINLDSEEEDGPSTSRKESHWKKKLSEEFSYPSRGEKSEKSSHRKRPSKKKPHLKRDNFIPPPSESDNGGPSNSKSAKQDHSYCTEDGFHSCEPSSSSSRPSCVSSSSRIKGSAKRCDSGQSSRGRNHIHLNNVTLIYSDDEENLVRTHKQKYKSKHREKYRQKSSHYERNHERSSSYNSEANFYRSGSPSRERIPALKRVKKDHRSKVKGSSRSASGPIDSHNSPHSNYRISSSSSPANSWERSDCTWSPTSSGTAQGSSQRDQSWDNALSRDSSYDSRDSCYRDWRSDRHPSKSAKKSSTKKKKRSKHKHKYEKAKKSKKCKRKKKVKSKKTSCSYTSSDSDSDNSEARVKKPARPKRSRIQENPSSETDSSLHRNRRKSRKISSSDSSSSSSSWEV
ncbi:E3 ubiquitin-protein ligase Topors-like [Penaeus japonicus]|uniref:E3 ubiquitin-protein ligase Topors-like n=1 Tax=Penaeus japonicus TaxID=27405 RepID=UPI001C713312|nr:E3 ubiquitin-protein ligase Topors-like [Penaeus japonicus]